MGLVDVVRRHAAAVAVSGAVVLGGAGVATAVAVSPASEGSDLPVTTSTSPSAPQTTAPPPPPVAETPPSPVATEPVVEPPAATVEDVTEPTTQPAPEPAPEVDPADTGIGTTGPDGAYTPAPPRQEPGAPPVVDTGNSLPEVPPMPGETFPDPAG